MRYVSHQVMVILMRYVSHENDNAFNKRSASRTTAKTYLAVHGTPYKTVIKPSTIYGGDKTDIEIMRYVSYKVDQE